MPPYFRNVRTADILSAFLRLGFRPAGRGRGSHNKLKHPQLRTSVNIPRHRGTLPIGTVTELVRGSGVTDAEFLMALDGKVPERFR